MFNLSEIKTLKRNISYGSGSYGMDRSHAVDRSLNEMSLDNSKQHFNDYNWFDRANSKKKILIGKFQYLNKISF